MSVSSSPGSEKMNTRYSTPAPELDDHRPRLPASATRSAVQSPVVPFLEVQQPTPRRNTLEPGLVRIDETLREMQAGNGTIARDFEQVIEDDDASEGNHDDQAGGPRRDAEKRRRFTNRQGRTPHVERFDRSRDTSSTRSSSPANSIEAFAEPRRRQRANTAESRAPSFVENQRARTYSTGTAPRRPTLSNISLPPAIVPDAGEDRSDRDVLFPTSEEAGTYKIDFEELEEFVALSEQGFISDESSEEERATGDRSKVFHDLRGTGWVKPDFDTALTGAGKSLDRPLDRFLTGGTAIGLEEMAGGRRTASSKTPDRERFCFFSSQYQSAIYATKLGDFTANGTTFSELFDLGPEGAGTWWLDVQNPTKAETEVIAKAFKIHRMTAEDIYTQEAREKVELFPQYYFVCFRSYNHDQESEDFLDPVHVYIIVCRDGVLSFSYSDTPHAKNVRKRVAKQGDFMSLGPDYICYAMM